jgi:hypothetical protein
LGLVDLWRESPGQLQDKGLQQIIAFAGDGKLTDGGAVAEELRPFLSLVPADYLKRYAEDCLTKGGFTDSGLALQEVVNQIGRRLGFEVTDGRYRGTKGSIGFDGLWELNGHSIVIEVKTTDAYRLDLTKIANYRRRLADEGGLFMDHSSILIVVGREDTGDLEAQIRGSKHAWDVRLISMDSLVHLLRLKEDLEDPSIINRIHNILVPREFTKLDEIIDLVFSVTEDVKPIEDPDGAQPIGKKSAPVSFHAACITRIEAALGKDLLKRSRACFSTSDQGVGVLCAVSREYPGGSTYDGGYWFAFHPHQKEFLESSQESYIGFGCGSDDQLLLFPFAEFSQWLKDFNRTELEDRYYWHVRIKKRGTHLCLLLKAGRENLDVTKFLLMETRSG